MTVLIWRAGVLAADRRVIYDTARQGPLRKITVGASGDYKFAVAAAGSSESDEQTLALAREILDTGRRPVFKGDLILLIAAVPKVPRRHYKLIDYAVEKGESSLTAYVGKRLPDYLARGTGQDFALGSLRRGGTAIQAVSDAAFHCPTVGDGVNWVDTTKPLDKWRVRQRVGRA